MPGLASASEPTACAFGLLQCDDNGIVWGVDQVLGENMGAQLSSSDGLAEFIIMFGYFLRGVLLPFLIFIGFFFFLFNLARYFIFSVGNEEARKKAKSNTLWGLAAFVFISSLWGIVNILVVPQIDRERSICPDYLGAFCGNLGYDRVTGGYSGSSNIDFGNSSGGGSGGGSGFGGSGSGSASQNDIRSRLGELLFGNQQEQVTFNFRSGAPRAQTNTVGILPGTSCLDGFNTLQLAAEVENTIGSYLLSRSGGQLTWTNITDSNGPFSIQYDADTVNNRQIAGDTDLTIVHFHPKATPVAAGLSLSGYAPTPEDLNAICSGVGGTPTHVVVDDTQLWVLQGTSATCPRRAQEEDDLLTIGTLLQLALLPQNERNAELQLLYNWSDVPTAVRGEIRDYVSTDFSELTETNIVTMADTLARQGDMSISRTTPEGFCSSY